MIDANTFNRLHKLSGSPMLLVTPPPSQWEAPEGYEFDVQMDLWRDATSGTPWRPTFDDLTYVEIPFIADMGSLQMGDSGMGALVFGLNAGFILSDDHTTFIGSKWIRLDDLDFVPGSSQGIPRGAPVIHLVNLEVRSGFRN